MSPHDALNTNPTEFEFNLSSRLYRASTVMDERIGDGWLLYAPDFVGLPIVVDDTHHNILGHFADGATAGQVISTCTNKFNLPFDVVLDSIAFLEEKGFVRPHPATLPYTPATHPPPPSSMSIWLHLNSDCNLACSYCFVQEKQRKVMAEEVQDRVASAIACTVRKHSLTSVNLKLAGGEPTLNVPLMERIQDKVAAQLSGLDVNFMTSVLSNGTAVSSRLIDFLKRPKTSIGISVDGFEEAHDIHRKFKGTNRGSWKVIVENIQRLQDRDIHPHIMTTIGPETLPTLPELLEWIFSLGLTTRISVVRNPDCTWNYSPIEMQRYDSYCRQLEECFELALTRLEESSIAIDLANSLAVCELSFAYPAFSGVTCGIGRDHVVITTDGCIASCPMTVHQGGVLMEDDLLSACHNAFPYSPANRHQTNGEDCVSCQWYPVCVGGCPITNTRINGAPFSKSPFCGFYKFFVPRYVRFLGKKIIQNNTLQPNHGQ
jgi:uncharacterized protein